MIKQNLTEYDFIRREMNALKSCITTYMGFVIGGSSIFYLSMAASTKFESINANMIFTFFISSLIVSMVLTILFYKFNSHNRYSGYCKLLNQEDIEQVKKEEQYFSWEVCMDVLREIDDKPKLMEEKIKQIEDDKIFKNYRKELSKINSENENGKSKRRITKILIGFKLILETLVWRARPRSWNFPLYVTTIFFTINALFILTGIYYFIRHGNLMNDAFLLSSCIVILLVQVYMWSQMLKKLYELTLGRRTVEAYCFRFLPIRYDYVKNFGKHVEYKLVTLK